MTTFLLAALTALVSAPLRQGFEFRKVRVETIERHGSGQACVDVVLIGDGYLAEDVAAEGAFERDVKRAIDAFFAVDPFDRYRELFNFHAVRAVSFARGSDDRAGEDRLQTILDCSFDAPDSRLLVYRRPENVMRLAKLAPGADIVLVMANDPRYGGSGGTIWDRVPAPCFSSAAESIHIAVHELGHSLADLGDEYADPQEVERRPLPQGTQDLPHPNLTLAAFVDVSSPQRLAATAKWKELLDLPGVNGRVGAFEGGYYREHGVYRPEERCKMRSSADPFCRVCREEIAFSLHRLVGKKFDRKRFRALASLAPVPR